MTILKSLEEIFEIYYKSKDMADFHNLLSILEPLTLIRALLYNHNKSLVKF